MAVKTHLGYIGIGSNIDSGEKEITLALEFLEKNCDSVELSRIYKTPSVSGDGSEYYNAVARVVTNIEAIEFSQELKRWEISRGRRDREREIKIVPIDLDLVIYDDEVLRQRDFMQSYFTIGYQWLLSGADHAPSERIV
ncbi:MAG: 2-amino-4-hydroxy-6-hydroxymethyldihydropteridine diphosphokinase [Paramuribaculum sp.]|nr:2-amino-4-hydroxy-6-hydroxymethyldihydropteridine diphosphokinase [Paramuribaculum sp.]